MTFGLALAIVVVTRGSFERLGRLRVAWLWLLYLALAIQIALEFVPFPERRIEDLGFGILMLSYVLIMVFVVRNRRVQGVAIVGVGIFLNIVVIALNQGMPTMEVPEQRNGREVMAPINWTVKHRPASPDDKLAFLGDHLAFPINRSQPFSIGDIVIALGIVDICFEASRRPRRRGVYLQAARTPASTAPAALGQSARSSSSRRSRTISKAPSTFDS